MTKLENSKSSPCFEVNTLMDFVQKNLRGKQHQAVEDHLEDCAYCQDRVEDLQVFYREPVPQDNDYDQQRKSIKQALYRTTWKVYLQDKLDIGKKQVGQMMQNFVQPKFAFPILATFLAVFIFTNVQVIDFAEKKSQMDTGFIVTNVQNIDAGSNEGKTNMEQQVMANWKYLEEDNFGLGVDVDFWQRKVFLPPSVSTLKDKETGYRNYPILFTFS